MGDPGAAGAGAATGPVHIETAKEAGFTPGPEHFGYLLRVLCADTDEKAIDIE